MNSSSYSGEVAEPVAGAWRPPPVPVNVSCDNPRLIRAEVRKKSVHVSSQRQTGTFRALMTASHRPPGGVAKHIRSQLLNSRDRIRLRSFSGPFLPIVLTSATRF
jgi:hypothetical protein